MTVEVVAVAEGQSDELFLRRVLAPASKAVGVVLKPQTLQNSTGHSGGGLGVDRLKINARNTLRRKHAVVLTTFFDLYALDTGFPGHAAAMKRSSPREKAECLENALHIGIAGFGGCDPARLITHVQLCELEGLFFTSPARMVEVEPAWSSSLSKLQEIKESFETPAHINDSYETKPSARMAELLEPPYRKTRHAPLIGESIGLSSMLAACPHFAAGVGKLEALSARAL